MTVTHTPSTGAHAHLSRPGRDESADYYFRYIDQVEGDDILSALTAQHEEMRTFLATIDDAKSSHRYAPGKWSIKQTVAHLIDCERLFVFRSFWFARGFDTPLPSFDQERASMHDAADDRTWSSLVTELHEMRAATVSFYRHLPAEAWTRRGVASGNPVSVRALAYLAAGHVAHHLTLIRERYLTP